MKSVRRFLVCGVVATRGHQIYKLDISGTYAVLYSFTGEADGGQPWGGVTRSVAGDLYGTTNYGGKRGGGVVFQLRAE